MDSNGSGLYSHHHGTQMHYNEQQQQGHTHAEEQADYDNHVNQITIPSYVSSPTTPQTPFSPRAMAIQQLKRAASVREAAGRKEDQQQQQQQQHLHASSNGSDAGHSGHSHSPSGSSSGHGTGTGMSPSMSRAPSIKRLGLERSASDAARRLAMAKLTGEKVTAPPEYIMPKTPLPAVPLPSLADLQARHEQRLGLMSPEPVPSTSSASPPNGLSRNPSAASTALSRQLSAASARNGSSSLSRNPSLAGSLADGGTQSPALPSSEQGSPEGEEDEETRRRRTDERQEARSNLIRKLSRGRLAGATAAASIKERNAATAASAIGQSGNSEAGPSANPTSPGLQRRPSLADVLARAESRNQARSQTPETPSRSNRSDHPQEPATSQQILLPTPDTASRMLGFGSPASTTSASPSVSALRKVPSPGQYNHIPIPPTPESDSSPTSHTHTPSTASILSPGGGPSSGHESMYSAVSNFRPYRHTMERDRDSAIARMEMEDAFEFDVAALEAARASVATTAFGGRAKSKIHERHPLSDDEREEELEQDTSRAGGNAKHPWPENDATLTQNSLTPMTVSQQLQPDYSHFTPHTSHAPNSTSRDMSVSQSREESRPEVEGHKRTSEGTDISSHSARNRAIGSLPQTPHSHSPISPFTFSPTPRSPAQRVSELQDPSQSDIQPSHQMLRGHASQKPDRIEEPIPFLRHHQKDPNDDFPVSVISSRASTYPDVVTLPIQDHPPLPDMASLPNSMQSIMKDRDIPAQSGPPVPQKDATSYGPAALRARDVTSNAARNLQGVHNDQGDNAGPTSGYRFPTPVSHSRRPESISSSNDHHDDNLNNMINKLEAMQAVGGNDWPPRTTDSPPTRNAFERKVFDQQKVSLPRQPPQQVFPQTTPAKDITDTTHTTDQSEIKPLSMTHLASQLRQPSAQANGSSVAKSRIAENRKATPNHGVSHHHAVGGVGHAPNGSAAEVLDFVDQKPAYNSGTSAENESAPSLARTGTGSSSSGFSTRSDDAFAVTAAVLPPNQTKEQVMSRLSNLLSARNNLPVNKPSALENPPRHLLLHSPVLQVVNSNTVKDRYLFLFNDILVITKPIIEEDANGDPLIPNLNTKFLVKSIVELPKLKLTAQTTDMGEDPVQKRKHPLLLTFVDRFANDPRKAVSALVAKAGLSNDPSTIANLLFRNPELNRSQLGAFLANRDQKPVLKAYCDRFRLAGIRIEDALRVFIGSLRLPNDYTAAEYLLGVFASQWLASNPGTGMTNDGVFATKLVLSIMELNDALHSGIDDEATAAGNLFSFPNSAITVDDFIAAFRLKDPHGALPDEHLTRIYLSIRKDRLQQAADNAIVSGIPEIEVVIHPSKLPNRLTYRTASENISLTIPKVDPKFAIKLVGQDLRFEPPVLTFARSRTATFRVTPTALGSKAMLFIRLGQNAHLYSNLPINKTFSVERAFMNHTFQIAFVNHLGVKRKYLFSLNNMEAKYNWIDTLRTKIENCPIEQADIPRAARLSDAVSLQVLRDALIAPDEPAPVLANKPVLPGGRPGFSTPPNSRGRSAAGGGSGLQRSSSFSKTYAHGQGKAETDLNDQRRPSATNISLLAPLSMRRGSRDDDKALLQQQQQQQHYKTGHEIVTAVRQNSLLPLVLGFVSAGVEGLDAMPRKPIYPEAAPIQATPPQARGTGRFKNL